MKLAKILADISILLLIKLINCLTLAPRPLLLSTDALSFVVRKIVSFAKVLIWSSTMAGMLPGVECARRRRLHQKTEWAESSFMATHGSSRRSSFCLYTSNNETPLLLISSPMRSVEKEAKEDEKLDELVRVAKERLDGRLRAKTKPKAARHRIGEQGGMVEGEMTKKGGWRWREMFERQECANCL